MVLITGATGLVGSHLALRMLSSGKQVRALYRSENSLNKTRQVFNWYDKLPLFDKIEWVKADLSDIFSLEDALNQVTEVYHCAALVSFSPSDSNDLKKINAEGTANLVNACLFKDPGIRFIHVSSVAALGQDLKGITNENSGLKEPVSKSVYAITKLQAEREVWRGFEEGLNGFIVNPSVIIGPAEWSTGTAALFKKVNKGLVYYPPGSTGFVGVNDVVNAIIWLNDHKVSNESYILNSENLTFKDFLTAVAHAMGKPAPTLKINNLLAWVGLVSERLLSLVSTRKPKLSGDLISSLMSHTSFDSGKIKATGFAFEPVVEEVKRTAGIFKKGRAVIS